MGILITFLIIAVILMPKIISLYDDCDGYYARSYLMSIITGILLFISFGIGYIFHFRFKVCFGFFIALVALIFFLRNRR